VIYVIELVSVGAVAIFPSATGPEPLDLMKFTNIATGVLRIVVMPNIRYKHLISAIAQLLDKERSDSPETASHKDVIRHSQPRSISCVEEDDAIVSHAPLNGISELGKLEPNRIVANQHRNEVRAKRGF